MDIAKAGQQLNRLTMVGTVAAATAADEVGFEAVQVGRVVDIDVVGTEEVVHLQTEITRKHQTVGQLHIVRGRLVEHAEVTQLNGPALGDAGAISDAQAAVPIEIHVVGAKQDVVSIKVQDERSIMCLIISAQNQGFCPNIIAGAKQAAKFAGIRDR